MKLDDTVLYVTYADPSHEIQYGIRRVPKCSSGTGVDILHVNGETPPVMEVQDFVVGSQAIYYSVTLGAQPSTGAIYSVPK